MNVLDYIRAKLEHRQHLPSIEPFVRGFTGTIERQEGGRGYVSYGSAKKLNKTEVLIDELPVACWTSTFKTHLLKMQNKGDITDFVEDHTTTKVSFKVKLTSIQLSRMDKTGLNKAFRLSSNMQLTNMNAFDADNNIQKFKSAEDIADAYFPTRLSLYHDRKSVLQSEMDYDVTMLRNKARFIKVVSEGQVNLIGGRSSKEETAQALQKLGFTSISELKTIRHDNSASRNRENEDQAEESDASTSSVDSDYDYLLNMPLSSLTVEKIDGLNREAAKKEDDLKEIQAKKPEDMWRYDLEKLASYL
jgi:DNA topoisomerase-2